MGDLETEPSPPTPPGKIPRTWKTWQLVAASLLALVIGFAAGGSGSNTATDEAKKEVGESASKVIESQGPSSPLPVASKETPSPEAPKQYVEVHRLSGSSEKRGGTFKLSGSDAKIIYESKGSFFAIYVIEKGHSLEQEGGFPEVTCSEACKDETQLAKSEGEYYLEVKATGAWTVIVQELR